MKSILSILLGGAVVLVASGCASKGIGGWTADEKVEVKGVVVNVVSIAEASSRFWPLSDQPVAVLIIRPRSIVPATPELMMDGVVKIGMGDFGDVPFDPQEWKGKKVYLRVFRSYHRKTGRVGCRFNEVRTVDDIMPGYASEEEDAEQAIRRAAQRREAEPGPTDNPDDAQRLREDH